MAKSWQSASRWPLFAHFGLLQGLCAFQTPCNSFFVTEKTQGSILQLGVHRGCN